MLTNCFHDIFVAKLKKLKKEKILENGDDYEVCTHELEEVIVQLILPS